MTICICNAIRKFGGVLFFLLALFGGFHDSLSKTEDPGTPITPLYTKSVIDSCCREVFRTGNVEAYNICLEAMPESERIPVSMIMAGKYGYASAYYDVYQAITSVYHKNGIPVDSLTYAYLFLCLQKGAAMGSSSCNGELAKIYYIGISVPQDSGKAASYYYNSVDNMDSARIAKCWELTKQSYRNQVAPR